MANDDSVQSAATWPLVRFTFQVKWDNMEFIFQEVTGLSSETKIIEYRGANAKFLSTAKMPGIAKFANVTLKKGIFKGDKTLWDTFNTMKMNTLKRSVITISLLDENNAAAMSWKLLNAFPAKIVVTDMKSDANEVALETMELAHEGLEILK